MAGWDHDRLLSSGFSHHNNQSWNQLPKAPVPDHLSDSISGIYDIVPQAFLDTIYAPLVQFILSHYELHQLAVQRHQRYLAHKQTSQPFIIGLGGSVSAGKSTLARLLAFWLNACLDRPVSILTTDHFLYPNHVLEAKGLTEKKGFPESYYIKKLLGCLSNISMNRLPQSVPYYSHIHYDILAHRAHTIAASDIIILEGLNVLQLPKHLNDKMMQRSVSDYIHLGLFLDAQESNLIQWFKARLQLLCKKAADEPSAYLYPMSGWSNERIVAFADQIWQQTNHPNLVQNILPSRLRAHVILQKNQSHKLEAIWIRP